MMIWYLIGLILTQKMKILGLKDGDLVPRRFDLAKVRNPWGSGEFESGMWNDNGDGWSDHPEVIL